MKKSTAALLAAAGAAATAAAVPYFVRQNTKLQAAHYVFRSPKVPDSLVGYRIVQVSDLHNKEFGKGNCHLLALLEAQLPDLIVITGDLMDSYHTHLDRAVDFARRAALARIHVFPYSRRKGTVADAMEGHVDEAVKHERAKRLIELGNQLERGFVSQLIGTRQQVLFEQPAGDGLSEGYTGQYVRVRAQAAPGEIHTVMLERAEGTLAYGTIID